MEFRFLLILRFCRNLDDLNSNVDQISESEKIRNCRNFSTFPLLGLKRISFTQFTNKIKCTKITILDANYFSMPFPIGIPAIIGFFHSKNRLEQKFPLLLQNRAPILPSVLFYRLTGQELVTEGTFCYRSLLTKLAKLRTRDGFSQDTNSHDYFQYTQNLARCRLCQM